MISEDLLSTLSELANVLQTQRTLGGALANIAEAATTSVPRCDAASVALSLSGRPVTASATARVALELDVVQYDLHHGPCLTTFRRAEALRLDLVGLEAQMPHFAVAARRRGVVAVMSVPAIWGQETIATLNIYSRTGTFDESAEAVAAVLATQVTIAVSRSPEFAAARDVVEQAQRDADDLSDVSVATGMLMANQSCTAEQASGLLRQAAEHDERTIVEVAQRIIRQHRAT
ncbi:ANTAR domain-containing protein [Nocardioides sp. CGMCC 1.13656]|uniref:ANTAR domain-containing protein n=1 Tax=Nocardioides TaxID=1839 RepID=UPI0015EC7955|nr:ANTAR domain-containing protein [Nocardioides sp. CGMCC 1.13656]MBA2954799.1 ANTAR domain-containing protein [Nocardioides sp. CGMCC 1.13656]